VGQGIHTASFYLFFSGGIQPLNVLLETITTVWFIRCLLVGGLMPMLYIAVRFLKEKVGADYYDRENNFNPKK
jgi:hypothetical protein